MTQIIIHIQNKAVPNVENIDPIFLSQSLSPWQKDRKIFKTYTEKSNWVNGFCYCRFIFLCALNLGNAFK